MRRPPDGGKDSSPRSSEAEPWVKPTTSWRAPDGAQESSVDSTPQARNALPRRSRYVKLLPMGLTPLANIKWILIQPTGGPANEISNMFG